MSSTTLLTLPARRRARAADDEPSVPSSVQPSAGTRAITMVVLIAAALYFLLPLWWLFVQTTKTRPDMVNTPSLWFGSEPNLWENIRSVLTYDGGHFTQWLGYSLLYAGAAAVVGTVVSMACGYAFAKFRFRGRRYLLVVIMAGMLLPAALLTIPLFFVFSALGIVNTVWAIIIPSCVSPFGVFLSIIYCQTVPDELIEAARLDGASEVRIFFTIVLRLLSPAVVTVALFIYIGTWNEFLLPMVMLRGKDMLPVTLGLYTWQNYDTEMLTLQVLTGSMLSVIPVIVLFLALQRYWRAGLTQGAVKA
jgi:multiple sugar transport system permease protein